MKPPSPDNNMPAERDGLSRTGLPQNSNEGIITKGGAHQQAKTGKAAVIRRNNRNIRKPGYISWGPVNYSVEEFQVLLGIEGRYKKN